MIILPIDAILHGQSYSRPEIDAALAQKQSTLTFDDTPIDNSNNPVKSGGIKAQLDGKMPVAENQESATVGYVLTKTSSGSQWQRVSSEGGTIAAAANSYPATLLATNWSDHTYVIATPTGATIAADSDGILGLAPNASAAQLEAFQLAKIVVTSQDANGITVVARGQVPTINLNLELTLFMKADYYTKTEEDALLATKAPLASPALTGTPTAPTAAAGTNTTQIATTAFVQDELLNRPVGLTADLVLHVNATSGDDSNDGISTETALKTINAAVAKIPKDAAGRIAVISLANGTYAAASIDGFNGITLIIQKESSADVASVMVQGASITNNGHSTIIWSSLTFKAEVASNTYTRMANGVFSSCVFDGARLTASGNNRISSCTFRNISPQAILAQYGTVWISALTIENTVATGIYARFGSIVSVSTQSTTNNATTPYSVASSGRIFVGGRTYKENTGVENIYYSSPPFSITGNDKTITLTADMQNYSYIILYLTTSSSNTSGNRCMVRFTPWELPAAPQYVISPNGTDFYGVRIGLGTSGEYTQLRFISTTAPNLYIVQAVGVIR